MNQIKAVLTADIVNSSLLGQKQLDDLLLFIRSELEQKKAASDFYRGDSFHAVCGAEQALTLALRLRAIARGGPWQDEKESLDIRIAIGIGTIEEPVRDMATAKGEAFLLSGRELDILNNSTRRLAIRCTDKKIDAGMEGVALLADLLIGRTSLKQAETLAELLEGATQVETAQKLKKSQSTVNKLARAANWGELENAVQIYRKLVSLFIE